MNMNEFFTWNILGTFAGAVMATTVLTQFLKEFLKKIPTQFVSYFIALIVLGAATAASGGVHVWSDWAIIPLNAVLISIASNGAYSAIQRIK